MAHRPAPSFTGVVTRPPGDQFGRQSIPGVAEWLTDRRLRKVTWGRNHFIHRTPNGLRDPFSFWHMVDALLDVDPMQEFNSRQLTDFLNKRKPEFTWDAITVGRILNDIIESCDLANGQALDVMPIIIRRTSAGHWYQTSNQEAASRVLRNLLEDLGGVCEKLTTHEAMGEMPRRADNPLDSCPSLGVA